MVTRASRKRVGCEPLAGAALRCLRAARPRPAFVVMEVPGPRSLIPEPPSFVMASNPDDRRYFAKCGWFLGWLGLDSAAREGGYLIESAEPDYAAVMANADARTSQAHITIVSGVLCANPRRVRDNPLFRSVLPAAAPPAQEPLGCSFCGSRREPLTSPDADLLELVEKQFRGILKTAERGGRDKGIYEFYDIRAFERFDEVFAIVLRLKMPPAVFLFNPRVDHVLGARRRIERVLPGLARAGHEVRILSMGIENFSARENGRFNKDITTAQVDGLLALSRKWERAHPGVFRPFKGGGGLVEFGFILFTPWTTLADVRINLEAAAERNFGETGYWLYSTLVIYSDSPIYQLARRDGKVLAKRFPDRGQCYGPVKNEDSPDAVAAWRFRDARVAEYFAVLVRVCAAEREGRGCVFFRGDRDFELACGLYERVNQRVRISPLRFAFALLELMEAPRPPHPRRKLLRQALARAAVRAAAYRRDRSSPDDRDIRSPAG